MKAFLILICVGLLAGCGGYCVPSEWAKAEEVCSTNGGVKYVWVDNELDVICKNGAVFDGLRVKVKDSS